MNPEERTHSEDHNNFNDDRDLTSNKQTALAMHSAQLEATLNSINQTNLATLNAINESHMATMNNIQHSNLANLSAIRHSEIAADRQWNVEIPEGVALGTVVDSFQKAMTETIQKAMESVKS